MTLNTFHNAGVASKNVTLGIPRLKELIDVSKNMKTPSATVYLDGSKSSEELIAVMEHTSLKDVVLKHTRDPLPSLFIELNKIGIETEPNSDSEDETEEPESETELKFTCIELNSEKCIAKNISMSHISKKLMNGEDTVLHSSDNEERWLIWSTGTFPMDLHLMGVANVERIVMRQDEATNEWLLDTDGTNLMEILSYDGVDSVKTFSNDIVEISENLGIEAGRNALLNELRNVISFDGTYVNYRHLSVLVDAMTYRGMLLPMTRHGINRVASTSAFHRASFEETVDVLSSAGMFSERDPLKGITSSVMMGKLASCGTGIIDVFIDKEMLPDEEEPEFEFEFDENDDEEFESFNPNIEELELGSKIKGFEVPDYELELETIYKYVPSSPKFSIHKKVGRSYSNISSVSSLMDSNSTHSFKPSTVVYIPSSPRFTMKIKKTDCYIPSSPTYTIRKKT